MCTGFGTHRHPFGVLKYICCKQEKDYADRTDYYILMKSNTLAYFLENKFPF